MEISSSLELFHILSAYKIPDSSGKSGETRLLSYCLQFLGSVERYHFDFKEKHDRSKSSLDDDDKKNLAKAVSGFANSGGGVLIWGIEDKSLKPKPISDVQNFVSALIGLAPQVTDPIVTGIDAEWIDADNDEGMGYAFIHIPESLLPPHRVVLNNKEIQNHYYVRSGNAFLVATHAQLEDMFGRRPRPLLSLSIRIKIAGGSGQKQHIYVILGIENKGRGSAKSPFLAIRIHKPYEISAYGIDGNRSFGLPEIVRGVGDNWHKYGGSTDVVIHPGVTLEVTAVMVEVNPSQPSSQVSPLQIDYQFAAEGLPLIENTETIPGSKILDEMSNQI